MYVCELFSIRRRRERDHPEHAGTDPLSDGADGASLTGAVAPLKYDNHAQALVFDPILKLAQFGLKATQFLLVFLPFQLGLIVGFVLVSHRFFSLVDPMGWLDSPTHSTLERGRVTNISTGLTADYEFRDPDYSEAAASP